MSELKTATLLTLQTNDVYRNTKMGVIGIILHIDRRKDGRTAVIILSPIVGLKTYVYDEYATTYPIKLL